MPSAIDGPALHGPPLSNDHRKAPLLASIATILPTPGARLQPNTTSLAAVAVVGTASFCIAIQEVWRRKYLVPGCADA
jgi:hypothetical protein